MLHILNFWNQILDKIWPSNQSFDYFITWKLKNIDLIAKFWHILTLETKFFDYFIT